MSSRMNEGVNDNEEREGKTSWLVKEELHRQIITHIDGTLLLLLLLPLPMPVWYTTNNNNNTATSVAPNCTYHYNHHPMLMPEYEVAVYIYIRYIYTYTYIHIHIYIYICLVEWWRWHVINVLMMYWMMEMIWDVYVYGIVLCWVLDLGSYYDDSARMPYINDWW